MKKLLSMTVVVFAAATFLVSSARADNAKGTCNAIVATALGSAQHCMSFGCWPGDAECSEVTNALLEFFATPGCAEAYANGEVNGLPGNAIIQPAGPNALGAKHMQDVICDSIVDCGLCPGALAVGICPLYCM